MELGPMYACDNCGYEYRPTLEGHDDSDCIKRLRDENTRLRERAEELEQDKVTLREGWDREEKLRRDRDAAYQKRVEELERAVTHWKEQATSVASCHLAALERAEAAEAKLARCVEAALDLVGEYESHGGPGTHRTCVDGCNCVLPAKVAALKAAAKGE